MSGFDLFNPSALATDPQLYSGTAGADLQAAQHFPGGPVMLVFALFWAPIGPGIPAGVLLARHISLNPAVTFGLYALSDVLASFVCHPIFAVIRRFGGRVSALRWLGSGFVKLAMLGAPVPRLEEIEAGTRGAVAPALARVATVGFGVDVYTAGMLVGGLSIPRILGWGAAIAGDLVWFALLLGTSIAAGAIVDDDRVVGGVLLVAMILIPQVTRRFFSPMRRA